MQSGGYTIFGGSGLLGRSFVQMLARTGEPITVAVRRPSSCAAIRLKPMGDVGQISVVPVDLGDDASVASAVAGAHTVINLVGILVERGAANFQTIHVDAAQRMARAAAKAGARRFVQVSALGAATSSVSRYGRSKAAGENAVRAEFPAAVIVRPGLLVGPEDAFLNRFGAISVLAPVLPVFGSILEGGKTRFQPACVSDVAAALVRVATGDEYAGGTFELGGPEVFTWRELMVLVLEATGRTRTRLLLPVPFFAAAWFGAIAQCLPFPPLTRDQVRSLSEDNVVADDADGFAALNIYPAAISIAATLNLSRYLKAGQARAPGTI